jgi:hypothetical protein
MIMEVDYNRYVGRPFKTRDYVVGVIVGFRDEQLTQAIVDIGPYLASFLTKWVCPRCKAEKEELQAWTHCRLCGCELEPQPYIVGENLS